MDGSVRLWDLDAARELNSFTDNQGPVSAVLFLDSGRVILSASINGSLRLRSTRTGRLLRTLFGMSQTQFDLVLENASGGTMQVALKGGSGYTILPNGPSDGKSILAGSSQETAEIHLLRLDSPNAPPPVGEKVADPYAGFEELYRSVGLRIVRDGPGAGEVVLA